MQANILGALWRRDVGSRRLTVGAAAAALTLAVAACSSGTATAPSSGAPSSGPPSSQSPGNQVTVRMTDFHLTLAPQNFTPGTYTFIAVNAGQTEHAIEIAGPDVPGQRTPIVQPGQSARLTVTLQPGSYEMYCPVDGHKGEGMDTYFSVG
jgi:uncharacterized cupredoxin-like copper-binding protein